MGQITSRDITKRADEESKQYRDHLLMHEEVVEGCEYCSSGSQKRYMPWETAQKRATNWTIEGEPIENGFDVMAEAEEAAEAYPYVDVTEYVRVRSY